MAKLMRHEARGDTERVTHLVHVVAELAHQRVLSTWASQQ